jgi:hypothetical protein
MGNRKQLVSREHVQKARQKPAPVLSASLNQEEEESSSPSIYSSAPIRNILIMQNTAGNQAASHFIQRQHQEQMTGNNGGGQQLQPAIQREPSPNAGIQAPVQNKAAERPDALSMIVGQYPHLLGVLSAEQIQQVQKNLDLQLVNQKVNTEYNAYIDKLKQEGHYDPQYGVYRGADKDRLEQIDRKHKGYDLKSFELSIDTSKLLAPDILALQPWNREAESRFRKALYDKLSSEPIRLVTQSGLNPQPLFRFFWGSRGFEIPQTGGQITFDHLMKVYQFNNEYIKLVKDGPAMTHLRSIYNHVHGAYYRGQDDHMFLMKRANDHPIISPMMELVSWTSFPSLHIWDEARAALNKAQDAFLADQVELAGYLLIEASKSINQAAEKLNNYFESTAKWAGRFIVGLKIVEIGAAVFETVATGGLAAQAGAGLLGISAASAETAGVYGFLTEEAGQASAIAQGQQEDFDWGKMFRKGAIEAGTTFVGGVIGGKFASVFDNAIGESIAKAGFSPKMRKIVVDVLGNVSATPITTAADVTMKKIINGDAMPKSVDEFAKMVAEDSVKNAFAGVLLGYFTTPGEKLSPEDFVMKNEPGTPESGPGKPAGEGPGGQGEPAGSQPGLPGQPGPASPQAPVTGQGGPAGPQTHLRSLADLPVNAGSTEPELIKWPDGLAEYNLNRGEAIESFRASLEADPTREAGIWMNIRTGKHVVVQGVEGSVPIEWMDSPEFLSGDWRLVEHYHPGEDTGARYASPADYEHILYPQLAGNEPPGPVETNIRWKDAQSKLEFVTTIGYDPKLPDPFWIRYRDETGNWRVEMMKDPPWAPGSQYERFLQARGIPVNNAPAATPTATPNPPAAVKGPHPEPSAETARDVFTDVYQGLKKGGHKPTGSNRAIRPDPTRYPSVEIMPNGDVWGTYADVLRYAQESGLTAVRRGDMSTIEAHHVIEKSSMRDFGISDDEGLSIALEASDHSKFTTELPRIRSREHFYDIDEVFKAHAEMYETMGHPEWIPQLKKFLRAHQTTILGVYNQKLVPGAHLPDYPQRLRRIIRFFNNL